MNSNDDKVPCQGVSLNNHKINKHIGTIYRASGSIFIIKETCKTVPFQFSGNTVRGAIKSFSPESGTRMRRYLRECLPEYKFMVTLTYPFTYPTNGPATKEHLRRFLQELRREWSRSPSALIEDSSHSSFWFLEFQHRGAPHYHIFTTWAPSIQWVARTWYRIVGSEDIRHLHAGTRVEQLRTGRAGTISYASKYAAKMEQKEVPPGFEKIGRFWGVHGRRTTLSASTFVSRAQETKTEVKSAKIRLLTVLKRLIMEGRAEVIHRGEGVGVFSLKDAHAMRLMRTHVSVLMATSLTFDNMFIDAELDYGETLCRQYA